MIPKLLILINRLLEGRRVQILRHTLDYMYVYACTWVYQSNGGTRNGLILSCAGLDVPSFPGEWSGGDPHPQHTQNFIRNSVIIIILLGNLIFA